MDEQEEDSQDFQKRRTVSGKVIGKGAICYRCKVKDAVAVMRDPCCSCVSFCGISCLSGFMFALFCTSFDWTVIALIICFVIHIT